MSPDLIPEEIHRIFSKTERRGECFVWIAKSLSKGYGAINVGGKNFRTHRLICAWANGSAPENKQHALHTCGNRLCNKPAHLYWGNDADNARDRKHDGVARGGRCYATHCIHGHEFTEENIYWDKRWYGRTCKECRRQAVRRMRAKRK